MSNRCNSFLLVFFISSIHVLDFGLFLCVVVIWEFKADRLFPCWWWLKLAFNSCILRIELIWHVVKYLGSAVNISLHVLQIWNTLLMSAWLVPELWVDYLKSDYLTCCFFIKTWRSLMLMKVTSLLEFQCEIGMSHYFWFT
jgi:hypothetical protein